MASSMSCTKMPLYLFLVHGNLSSCPKTPTLDGAAGLQNDGSVQGRCTKTIDNAGIQVGTPELDESAHYLIAKAHELKSIAERERPDLLVEVTMSCSVNSSCLQAHRCFLSYCSISCALYSLQNSAQTPAEHMLHELPPPAPSHHFLQAMQLPDTEQMCALSYCILHAPNGMLTN